ncbi:MAG: 2-polyprenyl-6-methoxyphenol hydroxylase, partial [Sphingomonas bacterium]|nr:2-polyprenyl-6-methoxyphenol hydroxylase [Sphingomonas bacterium]
MLRVHNEPDALQRQARNSWFKGVDQLEPTNSAALGWLWAYDPVATALAEHAPVVEIAAPVARKRAEVQRAAQLLGGAITLEERTRQWVGEREGYARFLHEQCPPPPDAVTEPVNCDGVAGLMVTPPGCGAGAVTVLHLHGGGYTMGSARGSARLASHLAERAGGQALTIDYRLAPEHPFPAALEDALRACRWLRARDPSRPLVVSGEGAGGGLAVSLMVALRDAGEHLPDLLHLVSPFADLTLGGAKLAERATREPLMSLDFLRNLAGSYIGGTDFRVPLVSPVFADLRGFPPMLIQAAAEEALADDAVRLNDAARQAGVPVTLKLFDDSLSSFILFDFLPETVEALDAFGAFVVDHLSRRTASMIHSTPSPDAAGPHQ